MRFGKVKRGVIRIPKDTRSANVVKNIRLNVQKITDWNSFHEQFKELLGFPDSYGNNMDAWIDCMAYLDDPAAGMSSLTLELGEQLVIEESRPEAARLRLRFVDRAGGANA